MADPAGNPAEPAEEDEDNEEEKNLPMEFFAIQSFLAGTPSLHEQCPQPPLPSCRPNRLAPAGSMALPPGAERLFHSQVAKLRQFLSGVLLVALGEILVLRRVLELPGGVDCKILLMDLRCVNVHALGEMARLVSSAPFSPWRSWLGLVLSDQDAMMLPISLQPHVLEKVVGELGLSPEGPL